MHSINRPIKGQKNLSPEIANALMREHRPLVLYFYNKIFANKWERMRGFFPKYVDLDDILQACYIGLWDAISTHNPEKSKLSTWACLYMKRRVFGLRGRKKQLSTVYFSELEVSIDGVVRSYEESIKDERAIDPLEELSRAEHSKFLDAEMKKMPAMREKICRLRLLGYKFKEIAIECGVSRQRTHQIWQQFVKRTKGENEKIRKLEALHDDDKLSNAG
jgi:RNA polymerase sigma factor (sigma-70 family)